MTVRDRNNQEIAVGDRVKILRDNTADGRYVGRLATITKLTGQHGPGSVTIQVDNDGATNWSWTDGWLAKVDQDGEEVKRPSERVANLLQEWHRASQFSDQVGEIIRIGDALIDALLVEHGLPNLDTAGSASRGHYIETGRYLYEGESL